MRKILSVILAFGMAVSLAACSGSGSGNSTAASSAASSSAAQTTPAVTINSVSKSDPVIAESKSAGETTVQEKEIDENKKRELVISSATEGKSFVAWDPDTNMSNANIPYALQVLETPFKMNADGSIQNLLCTGYEWSDDSCHLTLHFRDDVYFSNGDPMTAEDIAWSLDNTAKSRIGATLWTAYDSCEVVGDHDVVINLVNPNAGLMNTLCSRLACIYDKKYYDQVDLAGYIAAPIGSGPYLLQERVLGDHQTYVVNENYWNKKEEGLPFYEKVTVKYLTDANTQMLALENGEVDVLLQASIGPFLRLPADSPIKYSATQASTILSLHFNHHWGPTANPEFRKFMQYAINRDEINIGVYEGMASIADTYLPEFCTGTPEPGTYTPVPDYDPEKAKQMLKDMGYNNEELILACAAGTKAEQACVIIQGQMLNLGVNCTVKALDQASYSALQKLPEGWSTLMRSAAAPSMDMDSMRTNLSYDYKEENSTAYNYQERYDDLEELFKKTTETADNEVRKKLFAEISGICNERAYWLPIAHEITVIGYNERVKGVQAYPMDHWIYYKEWY